MHKHRPPTHYVLMQGNQCARCIDDTIGEWNEEIGMENGSPKTEDHFDLRAFVRRPRNYLQWIQWFSVPRACFRNHYNCAHSNCKWAKKWTEIAIAPVFGHIHKLRAPNICAFARQCMCTQHMSVYFSFRCFRAFVVRNDRQ